MRRGIEDLLLSLRDNFLLGKFLFLNHPDNISLRAHPKVLSCPSTFILSMTSVKGDFPGIPTAAECGSCYNAPALVA